MCIYIYIIIYIYIYVLSLLLLPPTFRPNRRSNSSWKPTEWLLTYIHTSPSDDLPP